MLLPIRLSAANDLVEKYSQVVDTYIYDGMSSQQQIKSQLMADLNNIKFQCEIICTNMLKSLGYNGSLEQMEALLSQRISELQQETFFLNGPDLEEFIYDDLADTIQYDPQFQAYWTQFLTQIIQKEGLDTNSSTFLQDLTRIVNQELGHQIDSSIEIRNGVGIGGRDTKGRFALNVSEDFYKLGKKLAETVMNSMKNNSPFLGTISVNMNNTGNSTTLTFFTSFSHEAILSLMRLKPSEIIKMPGAINAIQAVNDHVTNYIIKHYQGSDEKLLRLCIQDVINYSPNHTAFFVGDALKDITGILGEIQGLYYTRKILQDNQSSNLVDWVGGINNPHSDLILKDILQDKSYGIQIKNTTIGEAQQNIYFESFKSEVASQMNNGSLNFSWLKEENLKFGSTLQQDPELFEAASSLLGMEYFNIPYITTKENGIWKAYEADLSEVPEFVFTRNQILQSAQHARKALTTFIAGMMYMQLTAQVPKGEANSLYIIGGTLAITSASILSDVINNITKNIAAMDFTFKSTEKKNIGTIVDFLNTQSGKHLNNSQFILQSSYNFYK